MSKYFVIDPLSERLVGVAGDLKEAERSAVHHQTSDFNSVYPYIVEVRNGEVSLIPPRSEKVQV